jgi:hypothetical protein
VCLRRDRSLDHTCQDLSTCLLVSRLGKQTLPPFSGADDPRIQGAHTEAAAHVQWKFEYPLTLPNRRHGFGHGDDSASQTMSVIWHSRMAVGRRNTVAQVMHMENGVSSKAYALTQSVAAH